MNTIPRDEYDSIDQTPPMSSSHLLKQCPSSPICYHCCRCPGFTDHVRYRESIAGAHMEWSSPEWVCFPEITSYREWFLWNTNSPGWAPFRMGAHDRFYFFHDIFFQWQLHKNIGSQSQIIGNHGQRPEITAECARKTRPYLPWGERSTTWSVSVLKYGRKYEYEYLKFPHNNLASKGFIGLLWVGGH